MNVKGIIIDVIIQTVLFSLVIGVNFVFNYAFFSNILEYIGLFSLCGFVVGFVHMLKVGEPYSMRLEFMYACICAIATCLALIFGGHIPHL